MCWEFWSKELVREKKRSPQKGEVTPWSIATYPVMPKTRQLCLDFINRRFLDACVSLFFFGSKKLKVSDRGNLALETTTTYPEFVELVNNNKPPMCIFQRRKRIFSTKKRFSCEQNLRQTNLYAVKRLFAIATGMVDC